MNLQKFFMSFFLLLYTTIIYILIEWQNNVDIRSIWLIELIIYSFFYVVYAFILLKIDNKNPQTMLFFLLYSIIVSAIMLGFQLTFALYPFDFYAINEGLKTLTWYEKIILSRWTFPIILITSLCCYALKVKLSPKEKP